ncbi:MAG: hypothetical protein ACYC1M_16045 [Armatimonadota bacterium]
MVTMRWYRIWILIIAVFFTINPIIAVIWWLLYYRLAAQAKGIFTISFVLVVLSWIYIAGSLILTVGFVNQNGMDVADPPSSPMAVIIGLVFGEVFIIPFTVALVLGVMEIIRFRQVKIAEAVQV